MRSDRQVPGREMRAQRVMFPEPRAAPGPQEVLSKRLWTLSIREEHEQARAGGGVGVVSCRGRQRKSRGSGCPGASTPAHRERWWVTSGSALCLALTATGTFLLCTGHSESMCPIQVHCPLPTHLPHSLPSSSVHGPSLLGP